MPSARDKCFKKSVEKLKDNGKLKDLKVQDQQRWVRDVDSKQWSQTSEIWYKVVGMVSRVRKAIFNNLPVPAGSDATRIPDSTLTPDGGNPFVLDNKFDGDSFRDGQLEDYNEINTQENEGPDTQTLVLNSEVCKCGEPGAPDPVPVPVPSPASGMAPMPGGDLSPSQVPAGEPVEIPTELPALPFG